MRRREIHRHQWTIRQMMTAVAVCAIGLSSPRLLVFGSALVFWWIFIVAAIYTRAGRQLAGLLCVVVLFAVLYLMAQPAVVSRPRGPRAAPPAGVIQQSRPAPPGARIEGSPPRAGPLTR